MRPIGALPIVLLGAGVALLVYSVRSGGASFSLVVIFPVVTGGSFSLLGGVAVLFAGLLLFPLVLFPPGEVASEDSRRLPSDRPPTSTDSTASESSGGVVLIGPIPIFFGAWSRVSRRTRFAVALVGAALLALVLVGFVFVR